MTHQMRQILTVTRVYPNEIDQRQKEKERDSHPAPKVC